MKKLLIILLFPVMANAQVDSAVIKLIRANTQPYMTFSNFDSTVSRSVTTFNNSSFNIDTLTCPADGRPHTVQITIENETGNALRIARIRNSNGVYSVVRASDLISYNGSGSWGLVVIGGGVAVRLTGINGTLNWEETR